MISLKGILIPALLKILLAIVLGIMVFTSVVKSSELTRTIIPKERLFYQFPEERRVYYV